MTCFWDGLRQGLNVNSSNEEFISFLKTKNTKKTNVLWNNNSLSDKELEENFIHIEEFNMKSIRNGYDCSTCDPFLILICEVYNINIKHNYNGNIIKYHRGNNLNTINFSSDLGHFWFK